MTQETYDELNAYMQTRYGIPANTIDLNNPRPQQADRMSAKALVPGVVKE